MSMKLNFEILPDYIEGAKEVLDTAFYTMSTR